MSPPPPLVETKHLHAFLVLAEDLHFGRAAVRLGMGQPQLSQYIRRIEAAVGHLLLERDTRNVALTPAGRSFVGTARAVLEQLAVGVEQAREIASGIAGRLKVGFTPTTALRLLARIVPGYSALHPRVAVELTELVPEKLGQMLEQGTVDIAIMRDPVPDDRFRMLFLEEEPYVVVLPKTHRLAETVDFNLADLADDPFVLFPRNEISQNIERVYAVCAEAGFVPRGVQEVPGWQTAIAMVGSGLGVTVLPASVDCLNLPGIVYRRVSSPIRSAIVALSRIGDERPMLKTFMLHAERAAPDGRFQEQ